tara:strand:+ start:1208 stop:1441 length:234 start_codon:yes stop_codon:yes gene_type:complete
MKKALIKLVALYQLYISPYLLPCCRFYPTCSEYTKQALVKHGVFKGFVLTVFRLCRCNPLFEGGVDLVPTANKKKDV